MIFETPFSSTVGVCLVVGKIPIPPFPLGYTLFYFSSMLSVDKVTNSGRSRYTSCSVESLCLIQMFWSKYVLYRYWFLCSFLNSSVDIVPNWATKCTLSASGAVAVPVSVGSDLRLPMLTGPYRLCIMVQGTRRHSRANGAYHCQYKLTVRRACLKFVSSRPDTVEAALQKSCRSDTRFIRQRMVRGRRYSFNAKIIA